MAALCTVSLRFYMKMATSYHTLYNWPPYVNTVLVLKVAKQWGERLAPLM